MSVTANYQAETLALHAGQKPDHPSHSLAKRYRRRVKGTTLHFPFFEEVWR